MKKIWKWLLFVLVILLAAGCVFLYRYINRIRYNDGYVNGNTAGNLYNEGYFCEKDGIVYFANPADNYCLYSMNPDGTNIKKLEDQSVSYINVDDHYIYYCKLKGKSADSFSFLPVKKLVLTPLSASSATGRTVSRIWPMTERWTERSSSRNIIPRGFVAEIQRLTFWFR